jgi:hypothetical protein
VKTRTALLFAARLIIVEFDAKSLIEGADGSAQFDAAAHEARLLVIDLESACLGEGAHGIEVLRRCAVMSGVLFA